MSVVSPPGLLTSDLPDCTGFSLSCGWVNSCRVYMGVVWYVLILCAPTSENGALGPGCEGQVVAVVTVWGHAELQPTADSSKATLTCHNKGPKLKCEKEILV